MTNTQIPNNSFQYYLRVLKNEIEYNIDFWHWFKGYCRRGALTSQTTAEKWFNSKYYYRRSSTGKLELQSK